jgi:hypothetical protein
MRSKYIKLVVERVILRDVTGFTMNPFNRTSSATYLSRLSTLIADESLILGPDGRMIAVVTNSMAFGPRSVGRPKC